MKRAPQGMQQQYLRVHAGQPLSVGLLQAIGHTGACVRGHHAVAPISSAANCSAAS